MNHKPIYNSFIKGEDYLLVTKDGVNLIRTDLEGIKDLEKVLSDVIEAVEKSK